IRPGNSAGPTFCPGMVGNDGTWTSTASPSSSRTAPKTASLNFIARERRGALLRHSQRLHHRAHVGVALRHVFREGVFGRPGRAEAALRQEVLILLAVISLLDRSDQTRLDVFRQPLWRREPAPGGGLPIAAGRLLDRRQAR